MKSIASIGKLVAVVVGLGSLINAASATTVQYTFAGETQGGVAMQISTAEYSGTVPVGEFIMTTSNPNFQSTLLTYCTDIGIQLHTPFNYTPTDLSAATGVNPVWITGGIQNVAKLWYNDKAAATTAAQTAGLQLAIWELLYNPLAVGSYSTSTFASVANGGFHVTSTDSKTLAAETYAASILNAFGTLGPEQNVEWLAPTEPNGTIGGSQGLLYETPGPTTPPNVPETTSTLGLAALAAIALGTFKKVNQSQA